MSAATRALARVADDLVGIGCRFALVGGLAVSTRAEPRFTRDLDFAVAVSDDAEAERTVLALQHRGYRVQAAVEHDRAGRLATVRFLLPGSTGDEVLADLLFASSGIETEVVAQAERLEVLPGVFMPVASVGHLVAMKVLSHDASSRPKDAQDLLTLLAIVRDPELDAIRSALALIERRGYHRGKSLLAELDAFLVRAGRRS